MTPEDETTPLLRSIEESLRNFQTPFQQLVQSVSKHQQSAESDRQKPHADSAVRLPVEIPEYYRSEESERPKKNFREKLRIGLEITGVILALAVAVITLLTLHVFRKQLWEAQTQTGIFRQQADQAKQDAAAQLSVATNQFIAEQRPYVWTHDPPLPPDPLANNVMAFENGILGWNIYYTNYGKSPAIGLCVEAHIETGKNALDKVVDINHNTCKSATQGIIEPPMRLEWTSAWTKHQVSDTELKEWMSTNYGLVVYGRLDYSDSFGKSYFSQFCMARQKNAIIAECKNHNHIQ
jgi:hypothetical protein